MSGQARPRGAVNDVWQLPLHDVAEFDSDTTPIPFLLFDLGTNVSEWTSSLAGTLRVIRGGSYIWPVATFAKAYRAILPTEQRSDVGVRCVAAEIVAPGGRGQ